MSGEVPSESLSSHLSERMAGRRLVAAVFTTYQFDPGFFEQEVLPVFVDLALSHVPAVRLVRLEEAMCMVNHGVAVYYDANGLVTGDGAAAKLDVARIPMRIPTGVFHPKNLLLLVESKEPDEDGEHPQTLMVGCLSANLTRSGWWSNVEVAHIEEVDAGEGSRWRDELLHFLKQLRQHSPKDTDHSAQEAIRWFVANRMDQQTNRSANSQLRTHFWSRRDVDLVDFVRETVGNRLDGLYMEIISPYFDASGESNPLQKLVECFDPKACRVFLPKADDATARVDERLYGWLREQPRCEWGTFSADVTRLSQSKDAGDRFVHAKVIRFFSQRPKREFLLVGSPNLTSAAHRQGGNLESAFLVQTHPSRAPDFWLEPEQREATRFEDPEPSSDLATSGGTRLSLLFDWETSEGFAYWDDPGPSPNLHVSAKGAPLFDCAVETGREWIPLSAEQSDRLKQRLATTTLLTVQGDGSEPGLLLVQERGMATKPSLLLDLTAADILRYWSLLTDAQRTAFIEARATDEMLASGGADLMGRAKALTVESGMFDRFAGFFHAFSQLGNSVRSALDAGRDQEAVYRLFGRKYDSLGTLLGRVSESEGEAQVGPAQDPVDRYLIALCARQLIDAIEEGYPDFWEEHAVQVHALRQSLAEALGVRDEVLAGSLEREKFLLWYENQFLPHARDIGGPE